MAGYSQQNILEHIISKLENVSGSLSFLRMSNTPLYGETTFRPNVYTLRDHGPFIKAEELTFVQNPNQ